jgi:hypothetical protein
MTASFPSPAGSGDWRPPMAWLPPFGHGNGLDDLSWAPLADVAPEFVDGLLAAFREAGVPAYAAPVALPPRRAAARRRRRRRVPDHRLWVGAGRRSSAASTSRPLGDSSRVAMLRAGSDQVEPDPQ